MNHHARSSAACCAAATLTAALAAPAAAQEAMYTNAATMPSVGAYLLRTQMHVYESGFNPVTGDGGSRTVQAEAMLQLGLDVGWALMARAIGEQDRTDLAGGGRETETEFASFDLALKHRFFMSNPGGIDTQRAAVIGGLRVDTGDSANVDPHLGVVYTRVSGLHGLNLELHYYLTTGGGQDALDNTLGGEGKADALFYNAAYVYRVYPHTYTSQSTGAWYVTAELNGLYETNGDNEIRFSPGFMYEGRRWGFEIMAQLPLVSDLDHRGELDWAIGLGVRYIF